MSVFVHGRREDWLDLTRGMLEQSNGKNWKFHFDRIRQTLWISAVYSAVCLVFLPKCTILYDITALGLVSMAINNKYVRCDFQSELT